MPGVAGYSNGRFKCCERCGGDGNDYPCTCPPTPRVIAQRTALQRPEHVVLLETKLEEKQLPGVVELEKLRDEANRALARAREKVEGLEAAIAALKLQAEPASLLPESAKGLRRRMEQSDD